jgi:tripartite-type tricarboxylate transporter receptor subunit TctC
VRAPADGHTLLLVVNTHAINSILITKLPYDPAKDFAPVGTFASTPFLLAVNPAVQASNLAEFTALARRTREGLAYGTIGTAGIGRLAGEMYAQASGATIRVIPYKGSAPLLTDFLSGEVNFVIDTPNVYLPHIPSGKVRPIAVSSSRRLATLPNVPTFAEAGLPHFDLRMWFGVLAPAGTPAPVIERLSAEIRHAAAQNDVKDKLAAQAFEPFFTSPAEFASLLASDTERFRRVVQSAGIKPE